MRDMCLKVLVALCALGACFVNAVSEYEQVGIARVFHPMVRPYTISKKGALWLWPESWLAKRQTKTFWTQNKKLILINTNLLI